MFSVIVTDDMHIRDERVLEFMRSKAVKNVIKISADEIATHFKCHANTARAILKRLREAGHIEILEFSFRGGYTYHVSEHESRN